MGKRNPWVLLAAILLCAASSVFGQNAVSAKSGMVNYFEGKVLLDGKALEYDRARFPQIPQGGMLEATDEGRAEVMLSPGVLMWVGEGAKVELVSDNLLNAKVRVLAGSVVISGTEFTDEMSLTVLVNDDSVNIQKKGIYRFDAAPASLYVYEGEATVERAAGETKVKKGRTLALSQPQAEIAKFDKDEASALLAWAESRDSQIQTASLSSARRMAAGGYPGLGYSALGGTGYWLYNPYFGMYSFVPLNSMLMSPFGYYYLSPRAVNGYYQDYYYGMAAASRGGRGASPDSGMSRGGFGASSDGFGGYSRGASSMGGGGFGGGRSMGSSSEGSFSRGSAPASGGSTGAMTPSAPSGASMGRGGSSAGRGGGGGRN
ncbi:MAG: hypothetical protein IT170_17210 [Bryobacterales bacterium]|nr:hypothetical protein [Bryobacterales bacterium]